MLLVLIRRSHALGDGEFGRSGLGSYRTDERLQIGIAEEPLEMVQRFPFIYDHDETSANPEAVVDSARGFGLLGNLGELTGSVRQSLAERRSVSTKFAQDEHTHETSPPRICAICA
jgi:hypothetical protein